MDREIDGYVKVIVKYIQRDRERERGTWKMLKEGANIKNVLLCI